MTLKNYFTQLLKPWKVITFALSTSFLTYMGTIAGDPTWDVNVSLLMASSTFLTSSFFTITFYHIYSNSENFPSTKEIFLSLLVYYISVGAIYDFYNLIILGAWPESSFENFIASSMFYFASGLFWGLDFNELNKTFLYTKRKSVYLICSLFITLSFAFFGISN